jgi:hypothetical protein
VGGVGGVNTPMATLCGKKNERAKAKKNGTLYHQQQFNDLKCQWRRCDMMCGKGHPDPDKLRTQARFKPKRVLVEAPKIDRYKGLYP